MYVELKKDYHPTYYELFAYICEHVETSHT